MSNRSILGLLSSCSYWSFLATRIIHIWSKFIRLILIMYQANFLYNRISQGELLPWYIIGLNWRSCSLIVLSTPNIGCSAHSLTMHWSHNMRGDILDLCLNMSSSRSKILIIKICVVFGILMCLSSSTSYNRVIPCSKS